MPGQGSHLLYEDRRIFGKIAANQKLIKDGTKEFKDLEKRLPKIKDVQTHNRIVTRMNALVDQLAVEASLTQVPRTGSLASD